MAEKNTAPDSLRGTNREYLREQDRTNELLADIAGVEYVSPGDPPKTGYMIEKRLLDAAQKKNELLDEIATGGGGGSASTLGLSIDYATDVISLKKSGEPIAGSGATLPAYGVSFDPTTGGLTLTKNGTAVQGQTVTIPNYGSPVGVTVSSAMTDHDTIYLYEGTTGGGYTNGHFYYWDGSAWADGGEYAAATVQTDKTLLVEDRAADAKATGEAIGDLKTQLDEISESTENLWTLGDIGPFVKHSGYLWLPAPLTAGTTYTFYADVESDDTYANDCRIYLALSSTGSTADISFFITRGLHQRTTFTVPADRDNADGFLIYASHTASQSEGDTATFSNIMLLNGDVTVDDYIPHLTAKDIVAREAVENLNTQVSSLTETTATMGAGVDDIEELIRLYKSGNLLDYSTITQSKRIRVSDGVITSATNQDVSDYIPVLPGIRITTNYYLDSGNYGNAFYDKNKNRIGDIMSGWTAHQNFLVPDGAYFMRLTIPKANLVSGSENAVVTYANIPRTVINEETAWLALGDSITYGVYSLDSETKVDDTNGWVKRLADSLHYRLNNQGVRGMGFVAVGGNGISWANTLDAVDALTGTYNLITVALGINDYNTSSVTLADISSAIDTGIQRLMAKYPQARLVFITPFNSNRRGDATTNYCYNYAHGGRSLKDIADLIKDRCEYFGVECIYASNGFLLNNYNMATLLPDHTHPSYHCHTLIAKNMAHYLLM